MKNLNFDELSLSPELHKAIKDMGFEETFLIQSQAIPVLLEGKDVIGQAHTGTGKTVAFAIPILEKIDTENDKLQAVILCPTRELTIQVAEEFRKLTKYKQNIGVLPIYGGQSIERQITALKKKPQIIIGTPGRVIDHLNRHTLKVEEVKTFVLDEADEMLNMGFIDDIEYILESIPAERQTIFFSATMPKQILELTKKFQNNPEIIKVVHQELTVPNIEQLYFEIKDNMKLEVLSRLLDVYNIKLGLIFCNTKMRVDALVEQLQARGYMADCLHGDMRQTQREQVMKKFRNGTVELLVATDVAARGIDVDDIEAVFNYDIPHDEEYYVHRIGRTGRAGKTGRAFTFVVGREIYKLRDIQKYTNTKMTYKKVPSFHDVEQTKTSTFLEKLKSVIDDQDAKLDKYVSIIETLMEEDYTALDISAALLKLNLGLNDDKQKEDIAEQVVRIHNDEKPVSGESVRLFINVGRRDGISPKDILGALAGETGVSGRLIGAIDILDKFSFVDVPKEYAEDIIKIMSKGQIKGIPTNLEIAAKSEGGDSRPRERSSFGGRDRDRGGDSRPRERSSFGGRDRGGDSRSRERSSYGSDRGGDFKPRERSSYGSDRGGDFKPRERSSYGSDRGGDFKPRERSSYGRDRDGDSKPRERSSFGRDRDGDSKPRERSSFGRDRDGDSKPRERSSFGADRDGDSKPRERSSFGADSGDKPREKRAYTRKVDSGDKPREKRAYTRKTDSDDKPREKRAYTRKTDSDKPKEKVTGEVKERKPRKGKSNG